MIGATFLAVAVGFPETKWHRAHPDGLLATTAISAPRSAEKIAEPTTEHADIEDTETPSGGFQGLTHAQTAERDPWLHKGTPSKQQFKLFQTNKRKLAVTVLSFPYSKAAEFGLGRPSSFDFNT